MNRYLRRGFATLGAAAALVAGLGTAAVPAHAATAGDDVLLGVFTNSANDGTDTFYMSANGKDFKKISTSFVDKAPNDDASNEATTSHTAGRNYPVYTQSCPSIIWYDNTFWVLSNAPALNDGRAQLIVSASKDLVHWSDPKDLFVSIPGGVKYGNNVVAADWAVDPPTNTPYVVFSAGFYGDFNGKPEQDNMRPYIAKLSLDAKDGFNPAADPKRNDASVLATSAEAAQAIDLSNNDRIDGSLYFEGGKAYLAIKRDGRFNEIYQASKPGASGWTKIADNLAVGSEAPSIAKLNGLYYLFTDDISSDPGLNGANGTRYSFSTQLSGGWSNRQVLNASSKDGHGNTVNAQGAEAKNINGPRHGTVITLTDPAAKQIVWNLFKSTWNATATSSFMDVADSHWAFNQGWLDYASSHGLMGGYQGNFAPDATLTRGQVAAVLYRIANPDSDATTNPDHYGDSTGFKDGGSQRYYFAAVKWLKDQGISTGDKDAQGNSLNTFRPDAPITRQELAAMVYRFAQKQGVSASDIDTGALNQFRDGGEVQPYAREAMAWCNREGIITGGQGAAAGLVMPGQNATRGQAAKIFTVLNRDVLKK